MTDARAINPLASAARGRKGEGGPVTEWECCRDAERVYKVERDTLEQVCEWAISHSFATGHADTLADVLAEVGEQVEELRRLRRG